MLDRPPAAAATQKQRRAPATATPAHDAQCFAQPLKISGFQGQSGSTLFSGHRAASLVRSCQLWAAAACRLCFNCTSPSLAANFIFQGPALYLHVLTWLAGMHMPVEVFWARAGQMQLPQVTKSRLINIRACHVTHVLNMPSPQSKSTSSCHPAPQTSSTTPATDLPFMHEDQQQPGQPRWGGVSTCGSGFQFAARRQKPHARSAACTCAEQACKSTGLGMSGLASRSCTRKAAASTGQKQLSACYTCARRTVRLHVPCSCSPVPCCRCACRPSQHPLMLRSQHNRATVACTVQAPAYNQQ